MADGRSRDWGGPTPGGYDKHECLSAMQKAIRRGEEELALHWALELEVGGWFLPMVNRLRVIGQEDIGLGDMSAVLMSLASLRLVEHWHAAKPKPNGAWKLALCNVVVALARAQKSRLSDNMVTAIHAKRRDGGPDGGPWVPEMPDEAVDKHTSRGKKRGRGFQHFVEEGTRLVPESGIADPYRAAAEREWRRRDAMRSSSYSGLAYGQPYRLDPGEAPDELVQQGDAFEGD